MATTAQALAFALFLAIPSMALVVLGSFSLVGDERDVMGLVDRLGSVLPAEATVLLTESLERSVDQPGRGLAMTVVGALLALWSVTSAATSLMEGITTAFDRTDERSFLRKRSLALLLAACLGIAGALVFGLLVLGTHVESWVGDATGAPSVTRWAWWTAQWPVLAGGLFLAFAILFSIGPDVDRQSWRTVAPGALVALGIWLAASGGFAFYVAHFGAYEKTWGSLAAVVVTLVWLWLTSAALLLGAEVNAEVQRFSTERVTRLGTR